MELKRQATDCKQKHRNTNNKDFVASGVRTMVIFVEAMEFLFYHQLPDQV